LLQQRPSALADNLDAHESFIRQVGPDELQVLDGGENDGDVILQPARV